MAKKTYVYGYRNGIFGPRYWDGRHWAAPRSYAVKLTLEQWQGLVKQQPEKERIYFGYTQV